MTYSPKAIANFFIELAAAKGEAITPMKLQKLVYYAHGWYTGYTSTPLIDEAIEAWQYGPVIPSLYYEFKQFGANGIKAKATEFETASFDFIEVPPPQEQPIRKFLSNVWESYGKYTGISLSEMTHAEGSPWDQTWKAKAGMKGTDIPQELIENHFKTLIEKLKQKAAA
jgi:uncharacterized phage-associated protein